ncbi:hypothetical protein M3Y99_00433600 [Aphelenchoides fujianensis]|nr:hypothetical protein M3Y99_00433600 [Aphelenchoides fujianensis]
MRGGLYYNISLGEITKPIHQIQAFSHEQVYLLGSVLVDGWTKRGANWAVEWANPFAAYQPDAACTHLDDTGFKCRPEQVFVEGELLTQVNVQESAFSLGSTTSIYGIGFAHYGSHLGHGAVIANGPHASFKFCSVVQNAGDAVMLNGSNHVIESSLINYNGMSGIYGRKITGLQLLWSTMNFNFQRAPNFAACTGDSCLLAAADIGYAIGGIFTIDSNRFESNRANGLRVTADFPISVFATSPGATRSPVSWADRDGGAPTKNSLVRVRNNLFSNNLERQLSVWAASKADLATTFGIFDHNGYFERNATGTRPFQWGNQTFVYHARFVAASGFDKAPPSIDVRNQVAQPFFVNEGADKTSTSARTVLP